MKVAIFTQTDDDDINELEAEINKFIETVKVIDIKPVYEQGDEGLKGYRTVYVLYEEA